MNTLSVAHIYKTQMQNNSLTEPQQQFSQVKTDHKKGQQAAVKTDDNMAVKVSSAGLKNWKDWGK